jgi:hypothetical protein
VRRTFDHGPPRTRDLTREPFGDRVKVLDVFAAVEDERGQSKLAKPLRDVGNEQILLDIEARKLQLERAALHRGDLCAECRVDRVWGSAGAVDPEADVEIDDSLDISALDRILLSGAVAAHFLRPLVARQAGIDEHQRPHTLRLGAGDLQRDPTTERTPHERHITKTLFVKQRNQITRMREPDRTKRRATETAHVVPQRAKRPRKRTPLRLPHPTVADTSMHEHNRPTTAESLPMQPHTRSLASRWPPTAVATDRASANSEGRLR